MTSRKLFGLILGVFTVALWKPSALPFAPTEKASPVLADGSGPVPPLPPAAPSRLFVADGSGPVPPLPPRAVLLADGSGPVPPLPPKQLLESLAI